MATAHIEIELTRGYAAKIDVDDLELVMAPPPSGVAGRWLAHVQPRTVYAYRKISHDDDSRETHYLHRLLMGLAKGDPRVVDFLNGDGLDCRRDNMRITSRARDQRNRANGPNRGSTSGFLGVSFDTSGGRWRSQVKLNGRVHYAGLHDTEEDAAHARDALCERLAPGQYSLNDLPDDPAAAFTQDALFDADEVAA